MVRRRLLGAASVSVLAGLVLVGCSSASPTSTTASSVQGPGTTGSTVASSSAASSDAPAQSAAPVALSDADKVRNAVTNFEQQSVDKGGVTFKLTAPTSGYTSDYTLSADGSGMMKGVTAKDTSGKTTTDQTIWTKDNVYTQTEFLNADVKKIVDKIAPKAKWFEEPKTLQFADLTPARAAEAFLAYNTGVTCAPAQGGGQDCTINASGIGSIPGLGSFQTPNDSVKAVVTIADDGSIARISLFPGVKDMERQLSDVKFGPVTVDVPAASDIVTLNQVGAEAAKSMPAPSASAAPANSAAPASSAAPSASSSSKP